MLGRYPFQELLLVKEPFVQDEVLYLRVEEID